MFYQKSIVFVILLIVCFFYGNYNNFEESNLNHPKVSVIIPIYNMEKYLKECLDSIINQTLKDIEIICIDDGSIDNSLTILKEYKKKDKRIQILSQKNSGAAFARNKGINFSKGEFIAFLEGNGDKIVWWFKNGDEGKDAFGVKYFTTTEKEERLFYPDWIVRLKDGRIGIFDTKAGSTAKNPEGREKGLAGKIKSMNNEAGSEVFWGGLTVKENGLWYWHDGNNYSYTPGKIDERWKPLSF